VLSSFEALPVALKIGQSVMVTDERGRASRGKLVSISDKQLVVSRKRSFGRRAEQTFPREVVRRIDIVDSTWNGGVIGAATGVGLLGLLVGLGDNASGEAGTAFGFLTLPAALGGALVGGYIDHRRVDNPIYEQRPQPPRVTLAPVLGRNGIGVVARVGF
jgi:hypothetical protein